jgi:prophage regulatory protein
VTVSIRPIFVDLESAAALLSVSPSTVQLLVRNGELKPPRRISGNRVGYLLREIEEFAEARPVSDILPPKNTGAKKVEVKQPGRKLSC